MLLLCHFRIIVPVGDPWGVAITAASGVVVAALVWVRSVRWAKSRCHEALDGARRLPPVPERRFALAATTEPGPVGGARAREVRALQQALDGGWRDGALLARRAVPRAR